MLTSVKILIWEITHSAGVRVRLFSSTAEGNPDSSLYTLSGPVVLPPIGTRRRRTPPPPR